jgi:hypothetical protein
VTYCFGNRNFMQPMGRLSMHSLWAPFFPFERGVGVRGVFVFLSLFPMCSQDVPQDVLRCVPQDVPNSTSILSHIWSAQTSTHLNLNYYPGVHICFGFATWGPKRCFYWGHAQCSQKNCRWANQYGLFFF